MKGLTRQSKRLRGQVKECRFVDKLKRTVSRHLQQRISGRLIGRVGLIDGCCPLTLCRVYWCHTHHDSVKSMDARVVDKRTESAKDCGGKREMASGVGGGGGGEGVLTVSSHIFKPHRPDI